MGILIFLAFIAAIFALPWLFKRNTPCESCKKVFSRWDAYSGRLTLKINKIMCDKCARELVLSKDILNEAIKARNRITFDYTTEYGTSRRTVDPYFVEQGRLHGWCNQYNDKRTFTIKKMQNWNILPDKFEYKKEKAQSIRDDMNISPRDLGFIVYDDKDTV